MRVYRDKSKWVWALLVLFLAIGCGQEEQQSPIIVKVGDEELTLDELAMSIPEELREDITQDEIQEYISRWINSHILYQVGLKIGLGNDPVIRKRVHDFEVAIVGNAYLETMQNFKPLLSDSSIRAFYARNPDDFVREKDELHLQQILVDNKKTADSLYALFRKGAAFDSVAAKLNRNEKDGENWDLGYVALDDLIPVLANKVKIYRVGKVTRPIRTDFGYHLFKIVDRKKKGTIKDFDAVRNDIVARLMQDQHEEKYRQLMGQLKSTTKIETNFQLLNTISLDSLFQARKKTISSPN